MLLLVWSDLLSHAPQQNPTVDPSAYAPLKLLQQSPSKPLLGEARVMLTREARQVFYDLGPTNLFDSYVGRRLGLDRNLNLMENIPSTDGFYAIYLAEQIEIVHQLYRTDDRARFPLGDFLGVRWVNARSNVLEWEVRSNYMSLITGGQQPMFADPHTTQAAVFDSNFAPRDVVYLSPAIKHMVTATNRTQPEISREEVSAHRIALTVRAREPSMLVVAQAYYHPWRAYVDGKEVPLWKANYAFQALEVPAGHRRVELVYQDGKFLCGPRVSAITLLACLAAAHVSRRRPWRRSDPEGFILW